MKLNKEQAEFCKNAKITSKEFFGKKTIRGYLNLSMFKSIPEGFNPTVNSSLNLNGLTSFPEGFNPIVGGDLNLDSVTSLPKGFNPIVSDDLYLNNLKSLSEEFKPIVGGDLSLSGLTSIPQEFNLIVGGDLCLNRLKHIPKGFNPTVGCDLLLRSLKSIPRWFKPTVAGYLFYTLGFKDIGEHIKKTAIKLTWKRGDKEYISTDGILTEVISKKQVNGIEIIYSKVIAREEFLYIARQDNYSAHGKSIEAAIVDLQFKIASEKVKKDPIHPDTEFDVAKYRMLTGACSAGCKIWLDANGLNYREENDQVVYIDKTGQPGTIKAKELLPMLEKSNAYGYDKFKQLITW